ncbi:MAG: CHAD domain-containing protein [Thaumarchaeota archaeon]|nr:CHAD domain-containing protein [Nitrososphaerota archaeon]
MARTPSSVGAARFLEHYQSTSKAVNDRLREYLGDTKASNVQSLRGSIRRLDAILRVLPKEARRGDRSIDDCRRRCRKVLKLTSQIRDIDMILGKLDSEISHPSLSKIARKLKSQRREHVERSMSAAWKLFEMRPPELEERTVRGSESHARRMIRSLEGKVADELRQVLGSESRVEELHSLRKRCKRLRYTIELLPNSSQRLARARVLRGWQDALGLIRDSDVFIDRLGRKDTAAGVKDLIQAERLSRHTRYLRFVKTNGATLEEGRRSRPARLQSGPKP